MATYESKRPSWATTAYPKKKAIKKRPSTSSSKGSSLKRSYTKASISPPSGLSSSSTGWSRPPSGTKWIAPKSAEAYAALAHWRALPKFIVDPELALGGLSLSEVKGPPLPGLFSSDVVDRKTWQCPSEPPLGKGFIPNPAREETKTLMRMVLTGPRALSQIYRFRMANFVSISTNGAGAINAAIAVNSITLVPEFVPLTQIFDEFFVTKMVCTYKPINRYNLLIGNAATPVQTINAPIVVTSIQHGAPFPTTMATSVENPSSKLFSTGDPWVFPWINVEKYKGGTAVSPSTAGTLPVQGWALTSGAATYTGAVQFLAIPNVGLPGTTQAGGFMIEYHVLFRCRQ